MAPELPSEATQSTTVHIKFVMPVSGLPSSVEAQTSVMHASTLVVLAPGPQRCTLTVARLHWPSHASWYQSSWNTWMHSFYGKWLVQASKHRYTRVRNAVTLVWGSLSLVPRPLPNFISQPWRKISCEIKSGSGLGTRLGLAPIRNCCYKLLKPFSGAHGLRYNYLQGSAQTILSGGKNNCNV